jgi:hypothetical protein
MPAEQQYALVRNGALVVHREHPITTFHPAEDLRGDWLPIVNEDSEPFDPSNWFVAKWRWIYFKNCRLTVSAAGGERGIEPCRFNPLFAFARRLTETKL